MLKSAQLTQQPVLRDGGPQRRADDPAFGHLMAIFAIAVLGAATIAFAYWPGVMIDDARWQYQQSVDNAYEDWHPPLMAWIWHQLMRLQPGPGPMLILQLALYWVGLALVAMWLYRQGKPRFGIAAACVGWIPAPFALMGSVTKDGLMTGTLCSAVGLLLWSGTAHNEKLRTTLRVAALVLLLSAAGLRANAFLACVPLALAALPKRFTCTVPRFALAAVASGAIFLVAPGAVAAALHAEDTDSQLSLIIFDLGGITEHSGVNQFPDLHVANPLAINRRCYDPFEWDSYSTWAHRPCPLGFAAFHSLVDEGDVDPRMVWIKAILAHPVAYAEHRLTHFNLSTWFVVRDNPLSPGWTRSVDNPWHFQVQPNRVLTAADNVANGAARTPLGWPIFWIALALAVLLACFSAKLSYTVTAIAGSAFLYGMGYLIFGVATGMRYYVWTITGAALAAVLAAGELSKRSEPFGRGTALLAGSAVLVPTVLAAAARIYL